jgi:hypothetical protein
MPPGHAKPHQTIGDGDMGTIKGFGWLRTGSARPSTRPDPAEMGTAFGLDACIAATAVDPLPSDAQGVAAGAGVTPASTPHAAGGFWKRLGRRQPAGR